MPFRIPGMASDIINTQRLMQVIINPLDDSINHLSGNRHMLSSDTALALSHQALNDCVLSATHTARPAQASADARPFLRWQPPAVDTVHPSCVSPKRIVLHAQAAPRASAQIVGSLSRFIRHHVDIFPVLVILPVLHDRQIDRPNSSPIALKCGPYPLSPL